MQNLEILCKVFLLEVMHPANKLESGMWTTSCGRCSNVSDFSSESCKIKTW